MKFVEGKFGETTGYLQEPQVTVQSSVPDGLAVKVRKEYGVRPHWGYHATKRVMDIVGTFGIALIFLPALILIPMLIRRDGGPALFRQERIGKNGESFQIYKFRTMVVNAEENLSMVLAGSAERRREWKEAQKLNHDPRVTRLGKTLRKTSLDELPQIINVLKGDMSLVGPRPIIQEEIYKYGKWFGYYVMVKPGLTGLWQVRGRNDVSYMRRIALDRAYALNRSLWMEIKVIFKTPVAMFIKLSGR